MGLKSIKIQTHTHRQKENMHCKYLRVLNNNKNKYLNINKNNKEPLSYLLRC